MSVTHNIQCDDCKKTLWIGQRKHIYSSQANVDILAKFLHDHINHHLMFVNDENVNDDYEDLSDYD